MAIVEILKVAAVSEWLESEAAIHIMRDHPHVTENENTKFKMKMEISRTNYCLSQCHHYHSFERMIYLIYNIFNILYYQHGGWPMLAGMWGARLAGRKTGESSENCNLQIEKKTTSEM